MNTAGTGQTHLVRGASPTWSPDSKRIAFHASASGTGLPILGTPGSATSDSDLFIANVDDLLHGVEAPWPRYTQPPPPPSPDPECAPAPRSPSSPASALCGGASTAALPPRDREGAKSNVVNVQASTGTANTSRPSPAPQTGTTSTAAATAPTACALPPHPCARTRPPSGPDRPTVRAPKGESDGPEHPPVASEAGWLPAAQLEGGRCRAGVGGRRIVDVSSLASGSG